MSAAQDRGRDRLENWGLWSRLDGAPCDMKRQVNYYTPPISGDVWEGIDAESVVQPDTEDALLVERLVVTLGYERRFAVKLRYIEHWRLDRLARRLRQGRDAVEKMLIEIEQMVGRA